ncbi:MAG: TonB family protein [Proteobacteria bacterium]|nr:TonB family protein [Pseudomonadota bacterium]
MNLKMRFFSNMKLVTKTEAEIAKEQEELLKQRKEQWKRNNKEMIKNYGGVPKLQMQIPEVDGNMDRRIIQKVTKQHSGELRACYEKALAKTKGISGRIVVNWEIDVKGSVSKAEVKETTVDNPDVEKCFTETIKHWRFPSPKGGGTVQVDFPFELELQNELSDR